MPAPIQVARRGVVDSMFMPPGKVGGENEGAGDKTNNLVGAARLKKGTVPTIMEDDEE